MIGQRLPRRIDERSRVANDGSFARCATDAAKPFTIVGRARSRRSSVAAASAAFEHTSVAPATSVPSRLYAKPADPEERRVREQHLVARCSGAAR